MQVQPGRTVNLEPQVQQDQQEVLVRPVLQDHQALQEYPVPQDQLVFLELAGFREQQAARALEELLEVRGHLAVLVPLDQLAYLEGAEQLGPQGHLELLVLQGLLERPGAQG